MKLLRSTDSFRRDLNIFCLILFTGTRIVYGLTLWCDLGLLVGDTITVTVTGPCPESGIPGHGQGHGYSVLIRSPDPEFDSGW